MRKIFLTVCFLLGMQSVTAEVLTASERQTLREAHDAYAQALAERNANPGNPESSYVVAMQKHTEAEQLAMKIGRENKTDAIPFLLELQDQGLLRSFVNSYTAPTTPEVEALVLKHFKDPSLHPPEMSADILALIHQYHSRAMFDTLLGAIKEEINAPADPRRMFGKYGLGATSYLAQAIVKTDLPDIEADLVALLPSLDAYSREPVFRFLVERRYMPAEAALIDFMRRTPINTNTRMVESNASVVLQLSSQTAQDAVLQWMIDISRVNHREDEVIGLASQLEISTPLARLNRKLLSDAVMQNFTPAEAAAVVKMVKARDLAEKRGSEITPDNLAYWAQWSRYNDVLANFIKRGVDVNAKPGAGDSALIVAINYSNYEGVRLLLDAGANPNMKDWQGRTALFILSGRKSFDDSLDGPALDAARVLIAERADISAAIPGGWTPLHGAVSAKFRKMVELLVASGANVNAEAFEQPGAKWGSFGLTPLQLAEDRADEEMATYLRSKGAKFNYSFKIQRAAERSKAAVIAPFFWGMH